MQNFLLQLVFRLLFLFTAVPIHHVAKGYVSYRLGDPTAKNAGMLTLNPLVHLDPIGSLAILLVGFGWGKTTPTNPFYYKNRKRDTALVAFAGPAANLVLAFVLMFFLRLFGTFVSMFGFISASSFYTVASVVQYLISMNIWFAIFNLIPLPPMGGFPILRLFISDQLAYKMMQYQQYIMWGLLFALYTNVLTVPIQFVADFVYKLFTFILNFIPFV